MPIYRRPRRPLFRPLVLSRRVKRAIIALVILCPAAAFAVSADMYFRKLSGEIAISDASDLVTFQMNTAVMERLAAEAFDYDYFVTVDKDAQGRVSAIKTNMSRINLTAEQLLHDVINSAENGVLHIHLPLGNLTGISFLLGKGPDVPLKIIMLTSSFSRFRNELTQAGINQTRHQIVLELSVDIDVLVPWQTLSTTVTSEVIIAETVIIGSVPETYVAME